jgi:mRNA interferase MazF
MEKDFDGWSREKKRVHERKDGKFFHEREIWWCSLGVNVGYEEDGKNEQYERPILVVKKFNRDVLWALPLTRTTKDNQYYYRLLQGDEQDSAVILSQLRLLSSKRLNRRLRKISLAQFKEIVEAISAFLPR